MYKVNIDIYIFFYLCNKCNVLKRCLITFKRYVLKRFTDPAIKPTDS